MRVRLVLFLLTVSVCRLSSQADGAADLSATRLRGLEAGPHRVGFLSRAVLDPARHINGTDAGTRLGLAVWYPATGVPAGKPMTGLEYRLLTFHDPLSAAERQRFADGEIDAALGWRHVGIVSMNRVQALASLEAHGIAIPNAQPARGRFPVVMVLGGQYYLATTAELLASHGFVVAAAFRFSDVANEVGTGSFTWYLENSVRDAEWALEQLRSFDNADVSRVGALGHGGGGLQAVLFAMRNTRVDAVVNVDAGSFSSRTHSQPIPFYSSRLMRVPYLFVATAETRKGQDRWDDFASMRFSERIEVTLQEPDLRHHDLSDLGRSVTAPLAIRGESQQRVQHAYADVQHMTVRFFADIAAGRGTAQTAAWLEERTAAGAFSVQVHAGIRPAPTVETVLSALDAATAATLEEARVRDPEAPVFRLDGLSRIIGKALDAGRFEVAASIANVARHIHPDSAPLLDLASEAREGHGDRAGAADLAAKCAATPPGNDWRTSVAVARCRDRLSRLRGE